MDTLFIFALVLVAVFWLIGMVSDVRKHDKKSDVKSDEHGEET